MRRKRARFCVAACLVALTALTALSGCSGGAASASSAPTSLVAVASATATEIDLSWKGELASGAAFAVYRGTSPGEESLTPVGGAASTSYVDADAALQPSTTYYYYVKAVTQTDETAASNEASATTPDPGAIDVIVQ